MFENIMNGSEFFSIGFYVSKYTVHLLHELTAYIEVYLYLFEVKKNYSK
jgi:hypothetical protein